MPLYIPETFYPQTTTIIETKQLRDSGHKSMANLGCPALVTCSKNPLIVSTDKHWSLKGFRNDTPYWKQPNRKKKTHHPRQIQGTQQGHIPQHLPVAPGSLRGMLQLAEPSLRVGAVVQAHHKHRGPWGLGTGSLAIWPSYLMLQSYWSYFLI